jgi:phosphoserine aminotransferase
MKRANATARVIANFVRTRDWIDFLAVKPKTRSNTSVCIKITDPAVVALSPEGQANFAKALVTLLEKEGVAFDIGHYRDAPPGLRIWCGATVQRRDVAALMPWLDWAYATAKADLAKRAA